jgi:hypothetical protein
MNVNEYNQPDKRWDFGYVYVLDFGDGKRFKIGKTILEPKLRVASIQHGVRSVVKLPDMSMVMFGTSDNPYYLEQLLHMKFDDEHVGGEWFNLSFPDLVEIYQILYAVGSVELTDHWFEIVPGDYLDYLKHGAVARIELPKVTKQNSGKETFMVT